MADASCASADIHLDQVIQVFEKLLDGRMTRDEADRWAAAVVARSEHENIRLLPETKAALVWEDGIMMLFGIDLPGDTPDAWLHSDDDIRHALEQLKRA